MTVEMDDDQIKALLLNFLRRRRCWGAKYFNRQKLVRYLGQDVLGDGKKVSRVLDGLVKDRWVHGQKKGRTVSLNNQYIPEIAAQIADHLLPEYA